MNRSSTLILISLLVLLVSCGENDTTGPQRVVIPPTILSFAPSYGAPGTEVRIEGKGFGDDARDVTVELGDKRVSIDRISDDMILFTVPSGAATGPIAVTRLGARAESRSSFTVSHANGGGSVSKVDTLPPAIASIAPRSGAPGTRVTIRGTRFGWRMEDVAVMFGDARGAITTLTDTMIVTSVPDNLSPSDREVTVVRKNRGSTSRSPFSVLAVPVIITIDAQNVEAMMKNLSTIDYGGGSQVLRHDTTARKISYSYTFSNGAWARGPGGIDTLRGKGYITHSNVEWESWDVTIILNTSRNQLASVEYRRIRSGHSDGPTTASKSFSSWGSSDAFTLINAPHAMASDGTVECLVMPGDFATYMTTFTSGERRQSRNDFTSPMTFWSSAIVALPPSGPDAFIRVRYR